MRGLEQSTISDTSTVGSRPRIPEPAVVDQPRPLVWLLGSMISNFPFYFVAAAYVLGAFLMHRHLGVPSRLDLFFYKDWLLSIAVTYVCFRVVANSVYAKWSGKRLLDREVWRGLSRDLFGLPRLVDLIGVLILMSLMMGTFTAFKAAIPEIVPFSWDARLAAWDRWAHLGHDPWRLLQPIVGYPLVTWLLDWAYGLWFPVVWLMFVYVTWHGERETAYRSQYLLAFAGSWILLGTLAATALSSAGPAFFAFIAHEPSPYSQLVEYLRSADLETPSRLGAVWEFDFLWKQHQDPNLVPGEGISAMPSLHISMVVLTAIVGFRTREILGWFCTLFGVIIFVGSISLAWHYAIDGYVAAVATIGIWWISGRIVRGWRECRLMRFVSKEYSAHDMVLEGSVRRSESQV